MSTNIFWELTCDGLVSRPGEVKDSHPLNTGDKENIRETGDKRGSMDHLACKGSTLACLCVFIRYLELYVNEADCKR